MDQVSEHLSLPHAASIIEAVLACTTDNQLDHPPEWIGALKQGHPRASFPHTSRSRLSVPQALTSSNASDRHPLQSEMADAAGVCRRFPGQAGVRLRTCGTSMGGFRSSTWRGLRRKSRVLSPLSSSRSVDLSLFLSTVSPTQRSVDFSLSPCLRFPSHCNVRVLKFCKPRDADTEFFEPCEAGMIMLSRWLSLSAGSGLDRPCTRC